MQNKRHKEDLSPNTIMISDNYHNPFYCRRLDKAHIVALSQIMLR